MHFRAFFRSCIMSDLQAHDTSVLELSYGRELPSHINGKRWTKRVQPFAHIRVGLEARMNKKYELGSSRVPQPFDSWTCGCR